MLALNGLRVEGLARHLLFRTIDLDVTAPGLLFLVGAAGIGKSRLLQALAAAAQEPGSRPRATLHGMAPFLLRHLGQREVLPGAGTLASCLIQQGIDPAHFSARNPSLQLDEPMAEASATRRRLLAVLANLAAPIPCHLLDEPTAGLDAVDIRSVHEATARRASEAMLVVVTHNRRDCLALGGQVALLAGGVLQECAPAARFFAQPATAAGRCYVANGTCVLPPSPPAPLHGVWWAVPGLLCGLSRPGLIDDADTQFSYLAQHGVSELVCLEERIEYDLAPLRQAGIAQRHLPVPDMAAPAFDAALALCRSTEACLRRGNAVAMHCRGGLGRTGVALAAVLVWFGDSAAAAISRVRAAQPRAIQSEVQHRFIHEFAERVAGWNPAASPIPAAIPAVLPSTSIC